MKKVGILGTGWIAAYHVQALKKLNIEVFAVVGTSDEKAKEFAAQWDIPHYGTAIDLLCNEQITAVHICTPPEKHYDQIRLLLDCGKDIFCEKPLSLNAKEAEELARFSEKSVCTVGFNIRSYLQCQKARQLVQDGQLGRLLLIHGSYLQEFGAEPAFWSWRYESDLHAVTEIGSHWLDLAQYISGQKITAVSAVFDHFHPVRYKKGGLLYNAPQEDAETVNVPSEDVALIHFRTEKGAIGSVVLSELSHGHANELRMELTGENATLSWNSESPTILSFSGKGQTLELPTTEDTFEDTFVAQFRAFYDHKPIASFADAYRNVLLCEAIGKSAKNHSAWMEVAL